MELETATVRVNEASLELATTERDGSYRVRKMPDQFISWQLNSRRAIFEAIANGTRPTDFHAHLPVVATFNEELTFPVHTATKATGLLPGDGRLEEYIAAASACLDDARDRPWGESLASRIATAKRLYENPGHIDRRKLGLVEIFQGQTYRNLQQNPLMTIQYTGAGPEYSSYQLNGVVEQIGPGDPRFDFLHLMRMLFEYNGFHIQQPAYPSGYVFWISEIFDKSPRRRTGRRIA
jgi:hypothetical protein